MRRFLIAVITIMKDILIFAIFTYKLLLPLEFPPISTWHLSNQQVLIINYFFSTANILQVLQWQVTFRSLHPILRPHTYQQEERNRWSSFFLLSKQGLSPYHFPVTSDHSCNDSVGFADKSSAPAHYPLPKDMEKMRKAEKLEFLHGISEKVVHSFIFQSGEELQKLVDGVLTEEEKDILQQQELTAEGRFPCRFPGCNKSFKYNGKTRRNHELSHDPSVQFEDSLLLTQSSPGCTAPPEETKAGDDVYNYNCALLTDYFLFSNFLYVIKEGDGERIMWQYKYIMLYCKADGSQRKVCTRMFVSVFPSAWTVMAKRQWAVCLEPLCQQQW